MKKYIFVITISLIPIYLYPQVLGRLEEFLLVKSSPIITEDSIIFIYTNEAEEVKLAGDFTQWEPTLKFFKYKNVWIAVWKTPLIKDKKYYYKLLVDNLWTIDPLNPLVETNKYGETLSYFYVNIEMKEVIRNPEPMDNGYYRFVYFSKEAKNVYIVGNFNKWNPYNLPLKRQGEKWYIDLWFPPGVYFYAFIVDGKWEPDPLNSLVFLDKWGNHINMFIAK